MFLLDIIISIILTVKKNRLYFKKLLSKKIFNIESFITLNTREFKPRLKLLPKLN